MTKRGRRSEASLAIRPVTPVERTQRPAPPDELTDEQATEWRAVVARMPADWFARETWSSTAGMWSARRIHQLIEALQTDEELDFKAWHDALKMQQRESAVLCSLATKMRISQQATYDKSKKKGDGGSKKPWEDV